MLNDWELQNGHFWLCLPKQSSCNAGITCVQIIYYDWRCAWQKWDAEGNNPRLLWIALDPFHVHAWSMTLLLLNFLHNDYLCISSLWNFIISWASESYFAVSFVMVLTSFSALSIILDKEYSIIHIREKQVLHYWFTWWLQILKHLADLKSPWNCPHGRPTMRHLTDLTSIHKRSEIKNVDC